MAARRGAGGWTRFRESEMYCLELSVHHNPMWDNLTMPIRGGLKEGRKYLVVEFSPAILLAELAEARGSCTY
jgi:hypothetical protein